MLGGSKWAVWGRLGQILCDLAAHAKVLEVLCKISHWHKAVGLCGIMPVLLRTARYISVVPAMYSSCSGKARASEQRSSVRAGAQAILRPQYTYHCLKQRAHKTVSRGQRVTPKSSTWKDCLAHLLVFARGDLLQEVSNALALRAAEAQGLKEVQHVLARAMVH